MQVFSRFLVLSLLTVLTLASAFDASAQSTCRNVFNPEARELLTLPSAARPAPIAAAIKSRPLDTVKEIKVLQYNVENLFMSVGRFERLSAGEFRRLTGSDPKSPESLEGVAKAMKDVDADVMVMEEVEGLLALERFDRDYLDGKYRSLLIDGNDSRGIDVGFMVKRDLPLKIDIETHKDMEWTDPTDGRKTKLFSRDVPALIIRRQNESNTTTPLLVVLGNHAKSKRDRAKDPLSETLRRAQYEGIGEIIDAYRKRFGNDVPMMIAGDFNTTVPTSASVKPVHDRMMDAFDIAGLRGDERVTHTFHPHGGKTEYNQIDAVFVNPALANSVIAAGTYRYKDANGNEKPLPRTYENRADNPSDHFPVWVRVGTKSIFPEAHKAQGARPRAAAGF